MVPEQELNEMEFNTRVEIPIKQSWEDISDKEQIRIALEKFNDRLLDETKPNLKILKKEAAQPAITQEKVTFVFSIRIKQSQPSSIKGSEIRDLVKNSCFDEIPPDWALYVLSQKIGDRFIQFPKYKG